MTDDTVVGYRTVRALSEGGSARLILVHTHHPEHNNVTTERAASVQPDRSVSPVIRAIKRFYIGTATKQVLNEVDCLSRAVGEHIAAIDDLAASIDDSPILVLRWAGAGSLRRLLRERRSLRPGEAITIIAPLVGALTRAHGAGVAIGEVNVDAVHFDDTGRPFFTDFGVARLRATIPTPAELQHDEAFRDDRRQFATLANSVLAAVHGDREGLRVVRGLSEWLSEEANTAVHDWDQQVEQRLFDIGAPEPLRLTPDTTDVATATPKAPRLIAAFDSIGVAPASTEARSVLALPPWLDNHIAEVARSARLSLGRSFRGVAAWCRPVRTRTWVVAAIGIICVLAAGTIIVAEAAVREDSLITSTRSSESDRESESASGADHLSSNAPDSLEVLPSDPVLALPVLLTTRYGCLRDLSVVCLESVSPVGTPAYSSDTAIVDAILAGGELPPEALFDAASSVELQQLGDSVLFEFVDGDVSKPASVLLVKGEAGWRIRSYTLPE